MADRIQKFDFSVDLVRAILWQYNDAEKLIAILQKEQDWYNENQTAFWQDFYDNIFNLNTANEFGCSVWAVLLGVPLSIILAPEENKPNWGVEQYRLNFNNGNFVNDNGINVSLTLEQKRLVLKLRYYQLISRGTVTEINKVLKTIFSDLGLVYVLDGLDMTMTYVFRFRPDYDLSQVLTYLDLLPRPSGVKVNILYEANNSFGFENFRLNYNNGNFGD